MILMEQKTKGHSKFLADDAKISVVKCWALQNQHKQLLSMMIWVSGSHEENW